jgi:hypothetical protein
MIIAAVLPKRNRVEIVPPRPQCDGLQDILYFGLGYICAEVFFNKCVMTQHTTAEYTDHHIRSTIRHLTPDKEDALLGYVHDRYLYH